MNSLSSFNKGWSTFNSLPKGILEDFESVNNPKADFFIKTSVHWQDPNYIHKARFFINENNHDIFGFFSLTFARIKIHIPTMEDSIFIPFLWISNFAVNKSYISIKDEVEEELLKLIIRYSEEIHKISGCRFLIMEILKNEENTIIDDSLYKFFKSKDFTEIEYKVSKKSDFHSNRKWEKYNLTALVLDLRKLLDNVEKENLWS